ncbi:TonB-dependent receptor plug domain-containing protein [Elongatibacter sediminis]|uniref:TonB-dependent receptor n=1 Tax=Elongatibacter sediminis TaxID=3119006 RepID=A0AAW9RKJ4_9GAMM
MKHSRNPLYQAVQFALVPSAVAGFALSSSPVFAQDSDEEAADLDRVQVTGSRISRIDIEGANPVTVLDRDDIKRTGITDLGELVQDLPMMSGSPTSSQRNNGGSGRVAVDIRGLGTNRTLVLVNGKRLPSLFNDFSVIPVVMVERIEILKDGASAIYGADAVAGVVNIITRRDFEGAEFEFQIGESFDEGGTNKTTSFITGGNTDRGNFVIGIEYTEQDEVFLSAYDETYIRQAVTVYDPVGFAQFGFSGDPWTDGDGNGIADWGTFGSSRVPYGRFDLTNAGLGNSWTICRDSATGGASVDDYGPRGGDCNEATYDFAPVNYMQNPYERSSFFFQGDYELFDNVSAYTEARFANRTSEQLLAPQPYDSRFDPSWVDAGGTAAISADNYYNPFGVDIPEWRRRVSETGGRSFQQNVDQWQIIVGLTGDVGTSWTWDLSYNYGKNDRTDTDFGQFNGTRLGQALGPSFLDPTTGQVVCGTPDNPIADCVSLNPFTNPDTNPITQEMLDYVSIPLNDRYINERQITNLTLVGDLMELPAGPLAAAFGYERRKEDYQFIPDSSKVTDATTGNTGTGTQGSYDVDSFFGEINIPLLSGVSGAELLEVSLSGRYDDFSIFDSSTTFQGAIRWQPVRSLLLRATAGEVYREPNISELFAGVGDSFPNTVDPCSGRGGTPGCEGVPASYVQSDTQARARIGGNMNVTPEEGDTLTVGLAWSPTFLPGFSMTLDYWEIEIDDAINIPSSNVVLAGCFSGGVPAFCDNISRFPQGDLESVLTLVQKVGPETAEGIDWSFNYNLNTDIGLWDFSWYGTYNIKREQLVLKDFDGDGLATAESADVVGLFEHRGLGRPKSFPEWRWRFDTDWSLGDWGVSLSVEFIDSVTDCGNPNADTTYLTMYCPDDAEIVAVDPADTYFGIPLIDRAYTGTTDEVYYFDLVGRYTVPGWGSQVTVGITNLTDEELPFINQGFNATTDEDTFRAFGRSWFVNFKHSF